MKLGIISAVFVYMSPGVDPVLSELLRGKAEEYGFTFDYRVRIDKEDDRELFEYLLEVSRKDQAAVTHIGLGLMRVGYEMVKDGIPEEWLPGRIAVELMRLGLKEKIKSY